MVGTAIDPSEFGIADSRADVEESLHRIVLLDQQIKALTDEREILRDAARMELTNDGTPIIDMERGIVATLRSWKGHRYLVEAMQSLLSGSSNATAQLPYLLIVGDGPGREPLGTQIQALGLQQSVQMVGNQQDVVPWLQCLDVFALPS
jgi:glycosyltransferase involved in cell wall biosynthesis